MLLDLQSNHIQASIYNPGAETGILLGAWEESMRFALIGNERTQLLFVYISSRKLQN